MVEVSIIIPCRNDKYLYNLFSDLNKQTFKDFEVILIPTKDEFKNFNTEKLSKIAKFKFKFVIADNPISNKRNKGIEKAEGRYIVLLDDDVRVLKKSWLKELYNKIKNSKYDIIGGLLLEEIRVGETEALPSNNIIFRKDIYIPMDVNFRSVAQDTEWCFRMYKKGYKLYQDCIAPVQHEKFSVKKRIRRCFLQGREWAHIIVKHGNMPWFKIERLVLSFFFRAFLEFLRFIGLCYGLLKYGFQCKILKKR
ncbi:MAG: glycosyltransferase family 2 protein [Candidatus Aenigmarchaeota archaeon]|nr:glycosyltransferase family 2 protein [Candidatus Aenigmarchaeota archaeon]